MKKSVLIMFVVLAFLACNTQKKAVESGVKEKVELKVGNDSTEYELIVFDPGYKTFLITQPYPKWYYTNDFYRLWNYRYVIEWNYRHDNPTRFGDFYETRINYDPNVDYGLDLNYQLYQYFQFIEKKYGIVLISRKGT